MLKKLFIVFVLLFFASLAYAQENNSSFIVGKDYSFTLSAPKGWIADSESGKSQGLPFVFYPKGSSWQKGIVGMYATVYPKAENGGTLEKFIERDISDFKSKSEKLKVTTADALTTVKDAQGKERKVEVRYFTGDQFGNYEAVAYIDEGKSVVSIILTSKTQEGFEASLPAFKELVTSYYFLTDKVKIEK